MLTKGGTQWHHYARSYLGKEAFDDLGEEHQDSLTTLLTQHYQDNRTTALSTRTLDADTFHLPAVRKILKAQGYDSTEIERVVGSMRDMADFHNKELRESSNGLVRDGNSYRRMILSETEKTNTLTKNPTTRLAAGIHNTGVGQRPIIGMGVPPKPNAVIPEFIHSAKVATRAVGDSTAGRSLLSGIASSASGAKVLQLEKIGRIILQSFG